VMKQTLALTNLGGLHAGDHANLERAMPSDGRFGGHVVQGHVDGTTRIRGIERTEHWEVMTLDLPTDLARYVVPQGTVILDGVALTVSDVGEDTFSVSLIPTTLSLTTLGHKEIGDVVNVEVDVIAKYVERLLEHRLASPTGSSHTKGQS
jgi:riboflavin synthase